MKLFYSLTRTGQNDILSSIIDELQHNYLPTDTIEDITELHNKCFNEDYFIVGYYEAEKWIKENTQGVFSCIEDVQDYEKTNFGETNTKINSESIVNMFAYIVGGEVLYNLDTELTVKEILKELEEL